MGGGISQEYELIDKFVIGNTPISTGKFWNVNTDDVIFKIIDIKGTEGAPLIIDIASNVSNKNIRKVFSGFISSATAKSKSIYYERITEADFKEIYDNDISVKTLANSEEITYGDKITRVGVATGTASKSITEGTVVIYGRKRI